MFLCIFDQFLMKQNVQFLVIFLVKNSKKITLLDPLKHFIQLFWQNLDFKPICNGNDQKWFLECFRGPKHCISTYLIDFGQKKILNF